jgi:DNA-binding NarL/FixJ family response regulator
MREHPDSEFLFRRHQRLAAERDLDVGAAGSIRVLLAEPNRMVAEALMISIDIGPSVEPIGYALDGWAALELVESLDPDVIVVGPRLTGLDSVTLARLLDEHWPRIRVVMLTDPTRHRPAPESSYDLPLDCSTDELIDAIVTVSARRALTLAASDA